MYDFCKMLYVRYGIEYFDYNKCFEELGIDVGDRNRWFMLLVMTGYIEIYGESSKTRLTSKAVKQILGE